MTIWLPVRAIGKFPPNPKPPMFPSYALILAALIALPAFGAFPETPNTEADKTALPSAEESLKKIALPDGFTATVFASEPAVQNPVGVAWDHRGRLWVAENYTYAERAKRFDLSLRDRVIILDDNNGDGSAESRKVFTDTVQMLTSVEVGRGGVWLMCPPQLLFIPDANADDVPDGPPQVMLDGFTVAQDNYHNFANGLRWGPDGWLYGRCGHSCPGELGIPGTPKEQRVPIKGGVWRFHPERKTVEVLTHGTTNPWGHDWDQHGEAFFINTVNGHLWHVIPGAHLVDSTPSVNPGVYDRIDTIADHWHFDTKGSWSDSRDGKANSLGGGHAHIGMMVYQADQWPASFRNKLFTLNMHGRRANVERLERHGCGYIGRHEPDVFISDDPWFRGMEISTGPDGSGFIVDWTDLGECHESTGVHRTSGRVFKVCYGKPKTADLSDLSNLSEPAIERLLRHPNAWYPRQLLMTASGDKAAALKAAVPRLQQILREDKEVVIRLRSLWLLHALQETDTATFRSLLSDSDEHLRVWAIRLLTDNWTLDAITGPMTNAQWKDDASILPDLVKLAESDVSGLVRLSLGSILQRLPVQHRATLATPLVKHAEDAADRALPLLVWFGLIPLADADPAALVKVAGECQWPDTVRCIARNLAARIESKPEPLDALLTAAVLMKPELQQAVLRGMSDGLQGWRKAPKPRHWDAFAAALQEPDAAQRETLNVAIRDLSTVFGDGRALDEVKKVVLDEKADMTMREAALKTLIEARPVDLRTLCESLLETRILNGTAVRGLALYDDPGIGPALAKRYRRFAASARPAVIDVLVSRPAWAGALLDQVKNSTIPRADLTAFHARQIHAFKDEALSKKLTAVWGELRESAADKQQLIAKLKADLNPGALAQAQLGQGRQIYQALCGACHTLYGEGGKVGPDLTGSGRANLDYLLENIVDPSAVVSADFRITVITLKDGRTLSGVVAAQTDRTVTLRQLTEETVLQRSDITQQTTAPISMMPEGMLLALQPEMVRNLIAYLMHPLQVPLPGAQ